jgi:hypothetical protein
MFAALSPKLIRESRMDRRTTYLVLFTLSLTSGIAGLPATTSAVEGPIGVAAVVRNTVSQLEPRVTRIAKGDEVVRNEVVRTAADSDARLVFRDDTNLSLGPGSTLKLDRTVFDDPKAGDIAIKLTSGAFRFVTGNSNKEAYEIKTPVATMGVRGTTLDVLVERRRNKVVLVAGAVNVCSTLPPQCGHFFRCGPATGSIFSVFFPHFTHWYSYSGTAFPPNVWRERSIPCAAVAKPRARLLAWSSNPPLARLACIWSPRRLAIWKTSLFARCAF